MRQNYLMGTYMPHSYAELDSSLSLAMMEEALCNPIIKSVLTEIATQLKNSILFVIKVKEESKAEPNLNNFAMQHSKGDKFLGALLPSSSEKELKQTPEGRQSLLNALDKALSQGDNISTCHDFLAFMKTIDGMAFMYDEFRKGHPFYSSCKDYIAPTKNEVAMRSPRPGNVLAATYGIGTEIGKDLVHAEAKISSCLSGKARFFISSPDQRIKTWFEKMADQSAIGKQPLPLIASPSNAAAKTLIMVLEMWLFLDHNNKMDLNKAQIFANCVMAYLVYSGHHSFLEVAEIWNRLLDCIAIKLPELLPEGTFTQAPTELRYIDAPGIPEKKLPYAVIGEPSSFLSPLYRSEVMDRMWAQLEDGLDLSLANRVTV